MASVEYHTCYLSCSAKSQRWGYSFVSFNPYEQTGLDGNSYTMTGVKSNGNDLPDTKCWLDITLAGLEESEITKIFPLEARMDADGNLDPDSITLE